MKAPIALLCQKSIAHEVNKINTHLLTVINTWMRDEEKMLKKAGDRGSWHARQKRRQEDEVLAVEGLRETDLA